MTGQRVKGFLTFLMLVVATLGALLQGNWSGAGKLVCVLIVGVLAYKLIGHFVRIVSAWKWDPYEVGKLRFGDGTSDGSPLESNKASGFFAATSWNCPRCRSINRSSKFTCASCSYRLL